MQKKTVLALALALLAPGAAAAGERAPVAALPAAPADKPVAAGEGVTGLKVIDHDHRWTEVTAATTKGYCLASRAAGFHLAASTSVSPESDDELWRFVESDGHATLERTRLELPSATTPLRATRRATVELARVAAKDGLTVWGFREPGGDVVLLVGGESAFGREGDGIPRKEDVPTVPSVWSSCRFGATRLSPKQAKAGTVAVLRGTVLPTGPDRPKSPPTFFVHASLLTLPRDPEPVLSVVVRVGS
jgi:hypothetical protein